MPRLPRVTLPETLLDVAIRGGLIDVPPVESRPSPALVPSTAQVTAMPTAAMPPAVAACDAAGELVGILRPHALGRWRLRPNFQGLGRASFGQSLQGRRCGQGASMIRPGTASKWAS